MADSVVVSRDSRRPPQTPGSVAPSSQRRSGGHPVTCNRCRKPLSTTVFVCACDCVFCEECTYNHFDSSSNCPTCNRVLGESDFMELVVADPSASTGTKTSNFQTLFTKQNGHSRPLAFQDLCARLLKHNDDLRAGTKFLMKQFLVESSKQGQRSGHVVRTLESLKQEHTALKQAHNSQRMRYEKAIESLQQQLNSAQKKLEDKDHQLMQFRKLHNSMTPESPRGLSHDRRRVSGEGPMSSQGSHQDPPMKGFMIQKEAQERAKQRALEAPQRPPVLGGGGHFRPQSHSGGESYATPAPVMQRPYSTGSNGSGGIRNLSSSAGYAFSGGAVNKRRRGTSPSMPRNGGGSNPKAMSPSQAFAVPPSGSYSVSRGSANFFQQQGGYRR